MPEVKIVTFLLNHHVVSLVQGGHIFALEQYTSATGGGCEWVDVTGWTLG